VWFEAPHPPPSPPPQAPHIFPSEPYAQAGIIFLKYYALLGISLLFTFVDHLQYSLLFFLYMFLSNTDKKFLTIT
jgi:hypothetical protein